MIASYYGFRQMISFYREMYNIGRDGMSVGDICDVFQQIHIQAKLVKVDGLSNINQFPCILCLRHHFVVLEKRKNEIYKILDPAI